MVNERDDGISQFFGGGYVFSGEGIGCDSVFFFPVNVGFNGLGCGLGKFTAGFMSKDGLIAGLAVLTGMSQEVLQVRLAADICCPAQQLVAVCGFVLVFRVVGSLPECFPCRLTDSLSYGVEEVFLCFSGTGRMGMGRNIRTGKPCLNGASRPDTTGYVQPPDTLFPLLAQDEKRQFSEIVFFQILAYARNVQRYSNMPKSMEMTKISAGATPAESVTSAGPGQIPASPQPIPNRELPITSCLSIRVEVGSWTGLPNRDVSLFFASENPISPTAMAPIMTKASDGSQFPVMSRKFWTFAGLAMPERISPRPKISPDKKAVKWNISDSQTVADDPDGDGAECHEKDGGDQRTYRETRQAADAVAAGTSRPQPAAESDQKACGREKRP